MHAWRELFIWQGSVVRHYVEVIAVLRHQPHQLGIEAMEFSAEFGRQSDMLCGGDFSVLGGQKRKSFHFGTRRA